jgi:hypothetical protein
MIDKKLSLVGFGFSAAATGSARRTVPGSLLMRRAPMSLKV